MYPHFAHFLSYVQHHPEGFSSEDGGGLLVHKQVLSVVNGSGRVLAKTRSPLPDLWPVMQQIVSRVAGRDIRIFMATVQVYFSNTF